MKSLIAHLIGQDALLTYHGKTALVFPELVALLCLLWLLLRNRDQIRTALSSLPKAFLYAAGLLALGGAISVAVSGSYVQSLAAYKAWILFPILAFFLLVSSRRGGLYARIALYGGTAAELLYSVFASQGHSVDGRLIGTFASPNYLSMLLGPVLVLLVLDAMRSPRRKSAWIAAAVVVGIGLLATKSIGGLAGLGGAGLYLLFTMRMPKPVRTGLGVALVLVVAMGGILLASRLQAGRANSVASRLEIWHTALVLGSERPLAGIGFNNFPQNYADTVVSAIHKTPIEWAVPLPHNLFLAIWLYTGVLGLGGLFFLLRETFKKSYGLVFLPFVALCVHGLFDTPYFYTPIVYVFWLVLATGMADSLQNRQITFLASSKRSTR